MGAGLSRPYGRDAGRSALRCERIGSALLVHAEGDSDADVREFAGSLAAEPGRSVVVVDVAPDTPLEVWKAVLDELAASAETLRLVPGRHAQTSTATFGGWLADQLGRAVIAHEGRVLTASGGGLYVPPSSGPGWLLYGPGYCVPHSRRFPTPAWECQSFAEPDDLAADTVVEPLPGGAWIHPAEESARTRAYRGWLISKLDQAPDGPRVVVGHPGAVPVPIDRVGDFWNQVPPKVRPGIRFAQFGPAEASDGSFGQSLADLFDCAVVVGTGVRVTDAAPDGGAEVRTVLPEGTMGWTPFASDLGYRPRRSTRGVATGPTLVEYLAPFPGLTEVSPGVYEYAPDTVLEVIQSGLWLRPAKQPSGNGAVRSVPPEPESGNLFFDTGSAGVTKRMGKLAADVAKRLEAEVRGSLQVQPADAPAAAYGFLTSLAAATNPQDPAPPDPALPDPAPPDPAPQDATPRPLAADNTGDATRARALPRLRLESGPLTDTIQSAARPLSPVLPPAGDTARGWSELPALAPVRADPDPDPAAVAQPPGRPDGPCVQRVPRPEASAVPPARGIQQERAWLRRSLSRQYDATANSVSRILSEVPGLRGNAASTPSELLGDLVAVRLYLTGGTRGLDDAVRTASVGPHVPFARCVASGLRHLPSHRGAVRLRADLTPAQLQWYRERRVVTEWAFTPALTSARIRLPGRVDILVWSMTARRTGLIDPSLPEQVVFLPGTSFKVLHAEDGARCRVLLREIADYEVGADGQVATQPVPVDEVAAAGLERADQAWQDEQSGVPLPTGAADRFSSPPGLIATIALAEEGTES